MADGTGEMANVAQWSLVGRRAESEAVGRLAASTDGKHRGVVLAGGSGFGKTHLLLAGCRRARSGGALVLRGACLNVGDAWPLHPLREAALRLADEGDPNAATRLVECLVANERTPTGHNALASVHAELTRLAGRTRVFIAIDDFQWADSTTRRLVRTILSGLTPREISLLLAVRTDIDAPREVLDLLAEFHRSPLVNMIELPPLDESATLELARSVSTTRISSREGKRLWHRSGGVPILTIELARHPDVIDKAPDGVRRLLEARLLQLPESAVALIRLVSVGARPLNHEIALRVLNLDDGAVIAAARAAVAADVLRAGPEGYEVVHDLFREVARAGLLEPERRMLHRRMAESLEDHPAGLECDPVELAHHWVGAGDGKRALRPFVAAARAASRLGAASEAWSHWNVATDILVDPPEWADVADLLTEAAEAAHQAHDHGAALQLIDWAERAAAVNQDPHWSAELGLARARYLERSGEAEAAERVCSTLFLDAAAPAPLRAEAGARSADLLTQLGRYREACVRADETLERSQHDVVDEAAELLALASHGYSSACLGDPESGRTTLRTALDRAGRSGDPALVEMASRHYADLLMGPLNELDAGVDLALDSADRLVSMGADPRFTTSLLAAATTGLFRLGRWNEATRTATAALESNPTGSGAVDLLLGRVRLVLGLGDFGTAAADLEAVAALIGTESNPRQTLPLQTLRAGLAMWQGELDSARESVDHAIEDIDEARFEDPWLVAPLLWHGLRAEALAQTDGQQIRPARVEELLARMAHIHEFTTPADSGEAQLLEAYHLLSLGEVGRATGESDPEVWDRAATLWDQCGHPYPAAYARLQLASALFAERTRNVRAADALRSAHAAAADLEAQPLLREIEALARRARVDVTPESYVEDTAVEPKAPSPLDQLTTREHDVIAELSRGLSNREIGERLYISGRTVGVHVSNILSKLAVKTRVEAASLYAIESMNERGDDA